MVGGVNISLTRNLEKYRERIRNIPKAKAKYRTTRYSSFSGISLTVYFNDFAVVDQVVRAVDPQEQSYGYDANYALRTPVGEYAFYEKWRLRRILGCTKKAIREMKNSPLHSSKNILRITSDVPASAVVQLPLLSVSIPIEKKIEGGVITLPVPAQAAAPGRRFQFSC